MKFIFIFSLLMSMTISANAIIELRGGYGLVTPGKDFNTQDVPVAYGLNADLLIKPPMIPFGLGVRYENLAVKYDAFGGTTNVDLNATNIGLLLNYRIINTLVYLGPIAFVGLSNSASYKTTVAGVEVLNEKYKSSMLYSLGFEGGASLGLLSLGAEAGYAFYKYDHDTGTLTDQLDLSGLYAKILIGFGF